MSECTQIYSKSLYLKKLLKFEMEGVIPIHALYILPQVFQVLQRGRTTEILACILHLLILPVPPCLSLNSSLAATQAQLLLAWSYGISRRKRPGAHCTMRVRQPASRWVYVGVQRSEVHAKTISLCSVSKLQRSMFEVDSNGTQLLHRTAMMRLGLINGKAPAGSLQPRVPSQPARLPSSTCSFGVGLHRPAFDQLRKAPAQSLHIADKLPSF